MAVNIQLKDFTPKTVPVAADLVYLANSADSYNEVQSTLGEVLSSIPGALFVWNAVSGTTQAAAVENGYIINNTAQTTVTMPATASVGQRVSVQGQGAAGWIIQMNTGQVAHVGNAATSSAGTLTSTNQYDSVNLICIVANTTWATIGGPQGNITIA